MPLGAKTRPWRALLLVVVAWPFLAGTLAAQEPNREKADELFQRGAKSYQAGDVAMSLQSVTDALRLYQTMEHTERQQAACCQGIGMALRRMGKYEEALASHRQAQRLYRGVLGTDREQAACHANIGLTLNNLGKHEEAIATWENELSLYRTIEGTEFEQAACHGNIGLALGRMKKYDESIVQHQQALRLYRAVAGTEHKQAECHQGIGVAMWHVGRFEEAIAVNRQALHLLQIVPGTDREQADCKLNLGLALTETGKSKEALAELLQALALYKRVQGTGPEQADCEKTIAMLRQAGKDQGKADLSEPSAKFSGKEIEDANILYERGHRSYQGGDIRSALAHWKAASDLYGRSKGTERDQARCFQNIGVALDAVGAFAEAIDCHTQALRLYQMVPVSQREQAACFLNVGAALGKLNRFDDAIASQQQALRLFQGLPGTEANQADCYVNLGAALTQMHKHREGIASLEQALRVYQKKGNVDGQVSCRINIGVALDGMDRYEEAIASFQEALRLLQGITDHERSQAGCHRNIGLALQGLGKYEQALAKWEQALRMFPSVAGIGREQADCHVGIGMTLYGMGRYVEAIAKWEQALEFFRSVKGSEREQGGCQLNIGTALVELGKYEEGKTRLHQAMDFFDSVPGLQHDYARCAAAMAQAYLKQGDFGWAMMLARDSGRNLWIVRTLALAYHRRNQPGDAQQAVKEFVSAVGRVESLRQQAAASEHRSSLFEEPRVVLADFVAVLCDLAQRKVAIADPDVIHWARDKNGENSLREAAFHYADRGKGRGLEDSLREKAAVKGEQSNTKFLAEDKELSLRISKLASLREAMAGADAARATKLTQDIDDLQQRRNMIEAEVKRSAQGGYVDPEFRKPMEMTQDFPPTTAVLQYSLGEDEGWLLMLTHAGVTAHKLPAAVRALPETLARQVPTLPQLAEAWKTRPDTIGVDGLVRLSRARAEDLARREADRLNLVDPDAEQMILKRLGEVVLPASVLAELGQKGIHHLLVLPDGPLHYVPFAMLRVEGADGKAAEYLVERFAVSYVPAMTTLDTIRKQRQQRATQRKTPRRDLLAFANPDFGEPAATSPAVSPVQDEMVTRTRSLRAGYYRSSGLKLLTLPETEQEAMRVASVFGPPQQHRQPLAESPDGQATVFTGRGASETQVKRLLSGEGKPPWRYVVFSTHGLADTHNGMLSCLALSSPEPESEDDGFLQAQEVMNFQLDTDLVMLSACQTGLGRLRGGEGLIGLCGAFFYAGADSVCASLWQVPSGPTGQLVTEFFRALKDGNVSKSEALRQAQLKVLRYGQSPDGNTADYSSPFCWAAFVLIGEY